ncbi:MAG TPA: hypothetical protein VGX78_07245 [Pirellulales bacterium]|nr:hypothetical protein [Pirellulales bacterium]
MHPSFAISGFGRSGTKWLAELLDRSAGWTVRHEPSSEYHCGALRRRFADARQQGPYGEVNSYLLVALFELPVDRRGVIVRDPLDICVSAANRGHPMSQAFIDHLASSLAMIDQAIERGADAISFARMTSDLDYLTRAMRRFGVNDVRLAPVDLATKVNAAGRATVADWHSFDSETRGRIERSVRWFRERYGFVIAVLTEEQARGSPPGFDVGF